MTSLSRGDKARIALAPFHVIVGAGLCWKWCQGAFGHRGAAMAQGVRASSATPMVLVLGLLFVAYGGYRILLVARALKGRRST